MKPGYYSLFKKMLSYAIFESPSPIIYIKIFEILHARAQTSASDSIFWYIIPLLYKNCSTRSVLTAIDYSRPAPSTAVFCKIKLNRIIDVKPFFGVTMIPEVPFSPQLTLTLKCLFLEIEITISKIFHCLLHYNPC